jgi:hypothetical protein
LTSEEMCEGMAKEANSPVKHFRMVIHRKDNRCKLFQALGKNLVRGCVESLQVERRCPPRAT